MAWCCTGPLTTGKVPLSTSTHLAHTRLVVVVDGASSDCEEQCALNWCVQLGSSLLVLKEGRGKRQNKECVCVCYSAKGWSSCCGWMLSNRLQMVCCVWL